LKFSGRIQATDLCNYGIGGWTEAIALDQFYDETIYATICHGNENFNRNSMKYVYDRSYRYFFQST
jgi:hypothetical protein